MTDLPRVIKAMEANGWSWCLDTGGFRKTVPASSHPMMDHLTEELWVSREQAVEALLRAERGESYKPSPVSETVAKIVAKAANE